MAVQRFTTAATVATHDAFRSDEGEYVLFSDYDQLKKDMDRVLGAVLDMSTDLVVTKDKLAALYDLAEELEDGKKEETNG